MIGLAFIIISNDYIGPQKDISECISDRNIEIICGFKNPEDIVITPDNEFLLMSEFGIKFSTDLTRPFSCTLGIIFELLGLSIA